MDMDRLLPLSSVLGKWMQDLTAPELLTYIGLVAMLLFYPQAIVRIINDPLGIFMIMLVLGGVLAAGKIETDIGIVMFRHSTFFFAALVLLCKGLLTEQKTIGRVLSLILASGVAFVSYILYVQFLGKSLFWGAGHYEGSGRVGGIYQIPFMGVFYFGPNNISIITAILAVIAFTIFLLDGSRRKRIVMGILFVLNMIVLVATGSRASMAAATIVIAALLLYFSLLKRQGKMILYGASAISITIGLLYSFINPQVLQRMRYIFPSSDDPYRSMSTRLHLLEKGFDLLLRNPDGIGYGTFVTMNSNDILWEQNLFLNTALGAGLLGLIGFVGFFAIVYWRGYRKLAASQEIVPLYLLAGSTTFLINAIFTDPNVETAIYFSWLILGITLASVSITNNAIVWRINSDAR